MAVSGAFLDMLHEMLNPLGVLSVRRMFGAAAIYCDGIVFAIASNDELYFKADDLTKTAFESEGAPPFTYATKKGRIALPYWRAPERLFDDPDEMLEFARNAIKAAARHEATKARGRRNSGPSSDATRRLNSGRRKGNIEQP